MEQELRFEEGAADLGGGTKLRLQTGRNGLNARHDVERSAIQKQAMCPGAGGEARSQKEPYTGNSTARSGWSAGICSCSGEFAPISSPPSPLPQKQNLRTSVCVSKALRNLSVRCGSFEPKPEAEAAASRQRLQTQAREHVGRNTLSSSSR